MKNKLNWNEILDLYDNQWVELIDYVWPDNQIDPSSGIVRVHAKSRKEFNRLVAKLPYIDSAFVYVGTPKLSQNFLINTFNTPFIEVTKNERV